jgi:hypothetical protein
MWCATDLMLRLVFLDIDGVLNSDAFFARAPGADVERSLDPLAVRRLDRICAEGSAKVVITSTWRLDMQVGELALVLRHHGFGGEVIGASPSLPGPRGGEIRAWLDAHRRDWRSYVILDDRDDMGPLRRRLVQTSMARGLLDEHVAPALALLSRRAWWRW